MPSTENQFPIPKKESAFFNLLYDAENIQVQEISSNPEFEKRKFLVTVLNTSKPHSSLIPQTIAIPTNRDILFEHAISLEKSGEYILARNIYSFILKNNVRDQQALNGLGVCLYSLGEILAAKKCFRAVWDLYKLPEAAIRFALCLIKEFKDEEALSYLENLTDLNTLDSDLKFIYYKEKGNCATRCLHFKNARKYYQDALSIHPNSDTIYVNLGTLELQSQELSAATQHYRTALTLNPKNSKAYCGLGIVSQRMSEFNLAAEMFEKALVIDPNNFIAISQMVQCEISLNQIHRSKLYLTVFLENYPNHLEAQCLSAEVFLFTNELRKSAEQINKVLKLQPHNDKAIHIGENLKKAGFSLWGNL